MTHSPSRRGFLAASLGLSATLLASPSFAAASERKLVLIICRGAMDGLSVCPPIGDPDYAALRGPIAIPEDQALKLDGYFTLHPKLSTVHTLALQGQARLAPAVALPQHIRSHFEAQDLLESGGDQLYAVSTGWLNRALATAGATQISAISIGAQEPLVLRGPVQSLSWSPGGRHYQDVSRAATALQELYKSDPLLGPAFASGLQTQAAAAALAPSSSMAPQAGRAAGRDASRAFAETAARLLVQPNGPSIAVLSLDGFDTHAAQGASEGLLAQRLSNLDGVIEGLHSGLGPAWSQSIVIAATEFGRTARINGTRGTDHGTASTVIMAGGALKPGGIIGDWPTLQRAKLFEDRDLSPTLDMRQLFKTALEQQFGIGRIALDQKVFTNSAAAPPLQGVI